MLQLHGRSLEQDLEFAFIAERLDPVDFSDMRYGRDRAHLIGGNPAQVVAVLGCNPNGPPCIAADVSAFEALRLGRHNYDFGKPLINRQA